MHEPDHNYISPLVRRWMPDASKEEQIEASANLRRYLEVIYRIYLRLYREGRFPLRRDRNLPHDKIRSP